MTDNPFAVSAFPGENITDATDPVGEVPAGRLLRFAAALIDGIIGGLIALPSQLALGIQTALAAGRTPPASNMLLNFVLTGFAIFVVQGLMLWSRGQSVGKRLVDIQIVDYHNNSLLSLTRVFFIRFYYLLPLSIIAVFLPAQPQFIVNIVVIAISIIGVLLIFGSEQRCLHDLLAGSKVVKYKPNRPRFAKNTADQQVTNP